MKKWFLIFIVSLFIIFGFILARDFYISKKRSIAHAHDCCSWCRTGEMCLTVCLPCCDKSYEHIILLKKTKQKIMENNKNCANF